MLLVLFLQDCSDCCFEFSDGWEYLFVVWFDVRLYTTGDAKVSAKMSLHFSSSETRFKNILKSYLKSTYEELSYCIFKKLLSLLSFEQ